MRFTKKAIFKSLSALWSGVTDALGGAYLSFLIYTQALIDACRAGARAAWRSVYTSVRSWYYWGRRKHTLHRRTQTARKRLAKQMGKTDAANASESANEAVEKAASEGARLAPMSASQPATPSGDEPPMEVDNQLLPDATTVEKGHFYGNMDSSINSRGSVWNEFNSEVKNREERGMADELSVTKREFHDAEMLDAGDVVPPPYRSDVKKEDLVVRGAWETNPNASDEVQEATRFPLVDNQIRKMIRHLVTSNPSITGPEDQAEIIREWFEVEMEIGSNHERGLNRFIDETADQMLRYGSAAIIKQRTRSQLMDSYPDPVTGGQRAPVWGYALPDMSSLQVFIDKKGRPRKWRQHPHYYNGTVSVKEYRARDVFMARLPVRQSSMYFWTPSLAMPVIYAIEVLKDLHGTIESHTKNIVDIPSYVQVGDKDYIDGKATSSMLEQVAKSIRGASRGMMLVLPWYVNVEKLESEDYTEELVDVAHFWERIVRRGVGGSKLDDGEPDSANRSTSDTIDEMGMRAAQALVPELQRAFRWLAIDKLFEKGYTPEDLKSHDEMVRLEFEDINLDQQMAREGHVAFLWQNDLLRHSEARKRLDEDPDTEREDIYYSDIQKKIKTAQSQMNENASRVQQGDAADHLPDGHPGKAT
jgi:hypothetical protein